VTEDAIIEVSLERGKIQYKMRPCALNTKDYGEIFASLVRLSAQMLATEGHFSQNELEQNILQAFRQEISNPTTETTMSQLQ